MKGAQPPSPFELWARFRRAAAGAPPGARETWLHWAAWSRAEGRHVGLFEATLDERGCACLGYLTFSRAGRRGYAFEACQRILQHLFVERGARVVVADMARENAPARALAERLGLHLAPPGSHPEPPGDGPGEGEVRYLLEA
jgi:RimJ/RimL family protein N-acetyltransferase